MIYTVANPKGGAGKTVTALNLAVELNADLVLDLDDLKAFSAINYMREKPFNVNTPKSFTELYKLLDQPQKTIVVDCGGFNDELNALAVMESNYIITPSNDTVTELNGLIEFDSILERFQKASSINKTAQVLISRVHPLRKNFSDIYDLSSQLKHMKIIDGVTIPHSTHIAEAAAQGLAISESRNKAKFCNPFSPYKKALINMRLY